MGQIFTIGLATNCYISKEKATKLNLTKDEIFVEMEKQLYFEHEIFDFEEEDEYYKFRLKKSVFEGQLIPFLEKFYPLVYPKDKAYYYTTLEMLKSTKPNLWMKEAEDAFAEEFQLDRYGEYKYLDFAKPPRSNIPVGFTSIMLSQEGKIMMEEFGRQFNFFQYCIQQTFHEFPIAKALIVNISG